MAQRGAEPWARVSPGNNDSAGKRRSGRTGKGHRYVRRLVVQCAWAARKTPTYLGRTFRRLAGRFGKKKAAVAIAHKMLVLGYHLLAEGTYYDEQRYAHRHPQQENRWQRPCRDLRSVWAPVSCSKREPRSQGTLTIELHHVGSVSALGMRQKLPRGGWCA